MLTLGTDACTVTNPAEVAKTRLQLDGELQSRSAARAIPAALADKIPVVPTSLKAGPNGRVYSGPLDCLKKTWQFEGIRGVQRGLGAAVSCGARAGRCGDVHGC